MDRDSPSRRGIADHARRELEQAIAQLDRVNRFLALGTVCQTDPLEEITRAQECLRRARLQLSANYLRRIFGPLGVALLLAAPDPAPAISAWNTQCRSIVMQLKSKPGHTALVVGRTTEGEYCMAVWSAPSRAVGARGVEALPDTREVVRHPVVAVGTPGAMMTGHYVSGLPSFAFRACRG
jgi:hypothetical protein